MAFAFLLIACIIACSAYWGTTYYLMQDVADEDEVITTEPIITTVSIFDREKIYYGSGGGAIVGGGGGGGDGGGEGAVGGGGSSSNISQVPPDYDNFFPKDKPPSDINPYIAVIGTVRRPLIGSLMFVLKILYAFYNGFLVTGALMVTLYLGTRFLMDMDRENNEVPIANLTGIGWMNHDPLT